jgi:hypothetical protein
VSLYDVLSDDYYPGQGHPATQDASPFKGCLTVLYGRVGRTEQFTVVTRAFGARHHSDNEIIAIALDVVRAETGWAKHLVNLRYFTLTNSPVDPYNFRPYLEGTENLILYHTINSKTHSKLNRFDLTGPNNTVGRGMPYMRFLSFSGMNLSTFEEDSCCEVFPGIRQVFFHTNWFISELPDRVQRGLRELLVMKVQRNIITKLHKDLFTDTRMLVSLTLSDNKIAEIQPGGLPTNTMQLEFGMGTVLGC